MRWWKWLSAIPHILVQKSLSRYFDWQVGKIRNLSGVGGEKRLCCWGRAHCALIVLQPQWWNAPTAVGELHHWLRTETIAEQVVTFSLFCLNMQTWVIRSGLGYSMLCFSRPQNELFSVSLLTFQCCFLSATWTFNKSFSVFVSSPH